MEIDKNALQQIAELQTMKMLSQKNKSNQSKDIKNKKEN
jgi:hypothetical protein